MLEFFWENWLVIGLFAPFIWAVINLLDVFFVAGGAYRDEVDGTIISGIFAVLIWILPAFGLVSFQWPEAEIAILAIGAGALFIISSYYYFKALFLFNDATIAETLWLLSIVVVPILGFFLIGEVLGMMQYVGVALAFVGAALLSLSAGSSKSAQKRFWRVSSLMLLAVVALSLSMVIEEIVYEKIGDDFWSGYILFAFGATLAGLMYWLVSGRRGVISRIRKNYALFTLAEVLAIIATIFSQRAIDLSPAVSLVAVLDSLQPAFLVILSLIVAWSMVYIFRRDGKFKKIFDQQSKNMYAKFIALVIIVLGVYIVLGV